MKFYKFIFSSIRGNNIFKQNINLFWRDAIDDNFSLKLIKKIRFVDYLNDRKN